MRPRSALRALGSSFLARNSPSMRTTSLLVMFAPQQLYTPKRVSGQPTFCIAYSQAIRVIWNHLVDFFGLPTELRKVPIEFTDLARIKKEHYEDWLEDDDSHLLGLTKTQYTTTTYL